MIMNNWKFLINRLIVVFGMIGSFMGATFGFGNKIINLSNEYVFVALLASEFLTLYLFGIIFLIVLIDYIKDNRQIRKD